MPDAKDEDYYLASKGYPLAYDPSKDPVVEEHEAEATAIRSGASTIIIDSEEESSSSDEELDDEEQEDVDAEEEAEEEEKDLDEDESKKQKGKAKKEQGPYAKVRLRTHFNASFHFLTLIEATCTLSPRIALKPTADTHAQIYPPTLPH